MTALAASTTKNATARIWNVVRHPSAAMSMFTGGPSTMLPMPMPMSMQPEATAWRSGNHLSAVAKPQLPATPTAKPHSTP